MLSQHRFPLCSVNTEWDSPLMFIDCSVNTEWDSSSPPYVLLCPYVPPPLPPPPLCSVNTESDSPPPYVQSTQNEILHPPMFSQHRMRSPTLLCSVNTEWDSPPYVQSTQNEIPHPPMFSQHRMRSPTLLWSVNTEWDSPTLLFGPSAAPDVWWKQNQFENAFLSTLPTYMLLSEPNTFPTAHRCQIPRGYTVWWKWKALLFFMLCNHYLLMPDHLSLYLIYNLSLFQQLFNPYAISSSLACSKKASTLLCRLYYYFLN